MFGGSQRQPQGPRKGRTVALGQPATGDLRGPESPGLAPKPQRRSLPLRISGFPGFPGPGGPPAVSAGFIVQFVPSQPRLVFFGNRDPILRETGTGPKSGVPRRFVQVWRTRPKAHKNGTAVVWCGKRCLETGRGARNFMRDGVLSCLSVFVLVPKATENQNLQKTPDSGRFEAF